MQPASYPDSTLGKIGMCHRWTDKKNKIQWRGEEQRILKKKYDFLKKCVKGERLKLIFSHRLKINNLINLVSLQAKKPIFFIALKWQLWVIFIIRSAIIIGHDKWENGSQPPFQIHGPYWIVPSNCKQVNQSNIL